MLSLKRRLMTMSHFSPVVPDTLANHTICVTGHGGYVGRHVVSTLISAGHTPFLIGRIDTVQAPVAGAAMAAPWSDAHALSRQLMTLDAPVVLNIAGHFVSRHSATDIPALVSGNLEYPLTIFEAAADAGDTPIVNVGTSWEFSDKGAPTPANLYAQLKAANAQTLEYYARTRALKGVNLKLNDTFGGKDTRGKVMGAMRDAWLAGRSMQLRSWAQPINLLHITDVVEGLFAAAQRATQLPLQTVDTAFLMHDETVTLGAISELLADIVPEFAIDFDDRRQEDSSLRDVWADAPRLTQWEPRVTLEAGLRSYFTRGDPR
ncbi:NAD(P)-dependent oxidoreductase [uncultured Tateyamaria sp.]|uniref:NAD-dependent epimerase/dehydratase family protein n=2 Tax=uncultured Tateyamaria sp. TaxID=455651 RepID=UPI0026234C30|nr:NAD(P)-dependent oxidoreductase [uncultured Tateyamaria sp.]